MKNTALKTRIGRAAVASVSREAKTEVVRAGRLFQATADLARAWAFSVADAEQLEKVLVALNCLYSAADTVECLERKYANTLRN